MLHVRDSTAETKALLKQLESRVDLRPGIILRRFLPAVERRADALYDELLRCYRFTPGRPAHSSFTDVANLMRLSLLKAAHAVMDGASYRKSGSG
jgi:hypothetical protein